MLRSGPRHYLVKRIGEISGSNIRSIITIGVYLVFVFCGAAIVAPGVFYVIHWLSQQVGEIPIVTHAPFRRVINRCLLVFAIIGLWPLLKALAIRSWNQMGIHRDRPIGRDLFEGVVVGSVLFFLAGLFSLLMGPFDLHTSMPAAFWISRLLSAIISGCVVGFIEELLFRGVIYTALRASISENKALILSGALYSTTHFFAKPSDPSSIEWSSGFSMLGQMIGGFTQLNSLFPEFLNLCLLGCIFAIAYRKTGALFVPIGIHASLVFSVKLFAFATTDNGLSQNRFFGSSKLINGWLCTILFFGALGILIADARKRPTANEWLNVSFPALRRK